MALQERLGEERPQLLELTTHIEGTNATGKWEQLGMELKLPLDGLAYIRRLKNKSDSAKMSLVFQLWLDTYPNGTRGDIMQALKNIGEPVLANDILYTAMYNYGMKKGHAHLNIVNLVLYGPPCSGKGAFMNLFFNWSRPKHHHKQYISRPVQASEQVIGNSNDKETVWNFATPKDIYGIIADAIQATEPHDIANDSIEDMPLEPISTITTTPIVDPHPNKEHDSISIKPSIEVIDTLKKQNNRLRSPTLVRILDCGGQHQFANMSRAFVRGGAVNIITLNLTEKLSDKPCFTYSLNGKIINVPSELQMTNMQLIQQFVRSAFTSNNTIQIGGRIFVTKPYFVIIGTHYDQATTGTFTKKEITEETIAEKNRQILTILNEFRDHFIFFNESSDELIFPVDNFCRLNRSKISAQIRECIMSHQGVDLNVPVPIRWLMFEMQLKEIASTVQYGIVSLQSCYGIGNKLGMNKEDVEASLTYLDSQMSCFYYKKLLPNVVFTNPQYLLDMVTDIVRTSFITSFEEGIPEGHSLSPDTQRLLCEDGIFDESLLDVLGTLPFVPSLFTKDDFLHLLQYFHVIALIDLPDQHKYFIPAVLSNENDTLTAKRQKEVFSTLVEPLLITVNSEVIVHLQGLFPTFIASLLSREQEPHFYIDSRSSNFPRQLRHTIKLNSEDLSGSVILRDKYSLIEVYFIGNPNNCYVLRQVIIQAISSSATILGYHTMEISVLVRCNRQHFNPTNDSNTHPVSLSYKGNVPVIGCSIEELPIIELTDERIKFWLIEPVGLNIAPVLPNGKLIQEHVHVLLHALREVSTWEVLGIHLGVKFAVIEEIKKSNHNQVQTCRKALIETWLQGSTATGHVLITALKAMEIDNIIDLSIEPVKNSSGISIQRLPNGMLSEKHASCLLFVLRNVQKWEMLGLDLGIMMFVLERIRIENVNNIQTSRMVMIMTWLQGGNATINGLIKALEFVGLMNIANEVQQIIDYELTADPDDILRYEISNELPLGRLGEEHASIILSAIEELNNWEELSIHLGIEFSVIQDIQTKNFFKVRQCRQQIIMTWLKGGNATSNRLITALEGIQKNDIVRKLQLTNTSDGIKDESTRPNLLPVGRLGEEHAPMILSAIIELNDWAELGMHLGIRDIVIEQIKNNNPNDIQTSRMVMIMTWLQGGNATGNGLITALKRMDFNRLADDIQQLIDYELTTDSEDIFKDEVNKLPVGRLGEEHAPIILSAIKELSIYWEELGKHLGIEVSVIKDIKKSFFEVRQCHQQMIMTWLQGGNATGNGLITALREIGSMNVVFELEQIMDYELTTLDTNVSAKSTLPVGRLDERHVTDVLLIVESVTEWEVLGIYLKQKFSVIQQIKEDNYYQIQTCRKDMILKWLKGGTATSSGLKSAVMAMGRKDLAYKFFSQFTSDPPHVYIPAGILSEEHVPAVLLLLHDDNREWELFGIHLRIKFAVIEQIRRDVNPQFFQTSFLYIIMAWLERGNATCQSLKFALERMEKYDIASKLPKNVSSIDPESTNVLPEGVLNEEHASLILLVLKDLHHNWEMLGVLLEVKYNLIEEIRIMNRNHSQICCTYTIMKWLQSGTATRSGLLCALRNQIMDRKDLAYRLQYGENLMKKVDQKNLARAIQEGYIECKIRTAIVQGEARAGKTSVKCLILSQPYNKVSTGSIEAPQIAYKNVGDISVKRYGHQESKKCWALVDEEELGEKVKAQVRYIASHPNEFIKNKPKAVADVGKKEGPSLSVSIKQKDQEMNDNSQLSNPSSKPVTKDESLPLSNIVPPTPTDQDSSTPAEHPVSEVNVDPVQVQPHDDTATVKFIEQCKEIPTTQNISLHTNWLHFIDSGGQIQFQKVLPAFMPYASVLLLVINLANRFSHPSSTAMQLHDDQSVDCDKYSLSVEDVLKHLLSAIASSAQYYHSMIKNDPHLSEYITPPNDKLNVIAIGTHHDELNENSESINDKEKKLNKIMQLMKSKCEVYRNEEPPYNIMHIVDGLKATRGEFDDPVIDMIAEKLSDQAYEVKVPLKWYCLSILLRQEAKEYVGVLSVATCKQIGEQLYITAKEVETALKFFHALNMLLYYPDSPVSDLVFVRLESLVDIIKELMFAICSVRDNWSAAPTDIKELATEGRLSSKVLQKSETFASLVKIYKTFEVKLLALFKHLLIAAPLPEDNYFFMPALLPMTNVSSHAPNTDPFLFYFEDSVPMGLLCAIIVQLLSLHGNNSNSDSSNQWHIVRGSNFSNFFTLQNGKRKYMLVESLDCIQVYITPPKHPDYQAILAIERVIHSTLEKRKIDIKPLRAFYCTDRCSSTKKMQHVALINSDNESMKCKETNECFSIDKSKLQWFEEAEKKERNLAAHLQKKPNRKELVDQCAEISHKWYPFGEQLGVGSDCLNGLEQSFYTDQVKLSKVIQKWEDLNKDVTWATILKVVSGSVIENIALKVKIEKFLENKNITHFDTQSKPKQLEQVKVKSIAEKQIDSSPVNDEVTKSKKEEQTIITSADLLEKKDNEGLGEIDHQAKPESDIKLKQPDTEQLDCMDGSQHLEQTITGKDIVSARIVKLSVKHTNDKDTKDCTASSVTSQDSSTLTGEKHKTDTSKKIKEDQHDIDAPKQQTLTDIDLMKCSKYIDKDLYDLCGYLELPETILDNIIATNKKAKPQAHARSLLKHWRNANEATCAKDKLREILYCLDFEDAAKSLQA